MRRTTSQNQLATSTRRGVSLVLVAMCLVMVFAFVAFTVDIGHLSVVKAELQTAADAAALGSAHEIPNSPAAVRLLAKNIAGENFSSNQPPEVQDSDIELGVFNFNTKTFEVNEGSANAVKVTVWLRDQKHFFAPVIGHDQFTSKAESIAMLNPRDIAFVVDLSGSMNDDTEPCWATEAINDEFSTTIGTTMVQDVFDDFGYGAFPGTWQFLGSPLGLPEDEYAYGDMTKDDGLLTDPALAGIYRIANSDSEAVRKQKAYSWIIDKQIAIQMPNAKPTPDSTTNFDYWEKYIDYIMDGAWAGTPPPKDDDGGGDGGGGGPTGPKPPPAVGSIFDPNGELFVSPHQPLNGDSQVAQLGVSEMMLFNGTIAADPVHGLPRRGSMDPIWLPTSQDRDRINGFNNPNKASFPSVDVPWGWRNKIGYITYVQFMMDFGRERSPDLDNSSNSAPGVGTKTPLSYMSPDCPLNNEATAGGTFAFPPRSQPMHSVRRALIAAIHTIQENNVAVASGSGDRVSIVTFDGLDVYHMPTVVLPLTDDYAAAKQACTTLQSSADLGATTATDSGLRIARTHLENKMNNPTNQIDGPQGRPFATKVIVLLTDGLPNAWESDADTVDTYVSANPDSNFYPQGHTWFNSPIRHAHEFLTTQRGSVYGVGMGTGVDYEFMDRIARISKTAEGGQSPRSSGDPSAYEAQLIEIFRRIIGRPGSRLVQ